MNSSREWIKSSGNPYKSPRNSRKVCLKSSKIARKSIYRSYYSWESILSTRIGKIEIRWSLSNLIGIVITCLSADSSNTTKDRSHEICCHIWIFPYYLWTRHSKNLSIGTSCHTKVTCSVIVENWSTRWEGCEIHSSTHGCNLTRKWSNLCCESGKIGIGSCEVSWEWTNVCYICRNLTWESIHFCGEIRDVGIDGIDRSRKRGEVSWETHQIASKDWYNPRERSKISWQVREVSINSIYGSREWSNIRRKYKQCPRESILSTSIRKIKISTFCYLWSCIVSPLCNHCTSTTKDRSNEICCHIWIFPYYLWTRHSKNLSIIASNKSDNSTSWIIINRTSTWEGYTTTRSRKEEVPCSFCHLISIGCTLLDNSSTTSTPANRNIYWRRCQTRCTSACRWFFWSWRSRAKSNKIPESVVRNPDISSGFCFYQHLDNLGPTNGTNPEYSIGIKTRWKCHLLYDHICWFRYHWGRSRYLFWGRNRTRIWYFLVGSLCWLLVSGSLFWYCPVKVCWSLKNIHWLWKSRNSIRKARCSNITHE